MKIWLASYPRSGNTYFRILVHHYTGWPTYSWVKERIIPEGSVTGKAHSMTAYTPGEPPEDPSVAGFMKTHVFKNDGVPALLLLRDGRDAIISYAHYIKAFYGKKYKRYSTAELIRGLLLGDTGYEMWGSFARRWMDRKPPAVVLPFQRLTQGPPLEVLEETLQALGVPIPEWITTDDPPGFQELNKINPKFFRAGTSDQWKSFMTPAQQQCFQEMHVQRYGLEGEPWKTE